MCGAALGAVTGVFGSPTAGGLLKGVGEDLTETPEIEKKPDEISPEEQERRERLAKMRARQRAQGGFGLSDTRLTGPRGLGAGGELRGVKKLLGA